MTRNPSLRLSAIEECGNTPKPLLKRQVANYMKMNCNTTGVCHLLNAPPKNEKEDLKDKEGVEQRVPLRTLLCQEAVHHMKVRVDNGLRRAAIHTTSK